MKLGHPVGMRQGGLVRRQAQHQRGFGREGEKLGAKIQIENALMRRADRRQAPDWRAAPRIESALRSRSALPAGARRRSRAGRAAPRFLRWRSPPAPEGSRRPRQNRRWWRGRSRLSPKPPRLVTAAASATSAKAAALGAITCAACMPRRPQMKQIGGDGGAARHDQRCR